MLDSFSFSGMPKLILGPGSTGRLGEIAALFGKNALLAIGSVALERSGHLSRILKRLEAAGVKAR